MKVSYDEIQKKHFNEKKTDNKKWREIEEKFLDDLIDYEKY